MTTTEGALIKLQFEAEVMATQQKLKQQVTAQDLINEVQVEIDK